MTKRRWVLHLHLQSSLLPACFVCLGLLTHHYQASVAVLLPAHANMMSKFDEL